MVKCRLGRVGACWGLSRYRAPGDNLVKIRWSYGVSAHILVENATPYSYTFTVA